MHHNPSTTIISPLHEASTRCLRTFDELLEAETGEARSAIDDNYARFRIWAGNLGAFQPLPSKSSADFRLREAPEVASRILEILEEICETNEDVGAAIGEAGAPQPGSESEDGETSIVRDLCLSVGDSLRSLLKVSALLRKATTRDRYALAAASKHDTLPNEYDWYDHRHVCEKFPKTVQQTWLCERLAKAITQRRRYLRYAQKHEKRVARAPTTSVDVPLQPPTESSSHVRDKDDRSFGHTLTATAASTKASTLHVDQVAIAKLANIKAEDDDNVSQATSFISVATEGNPDRAQVVKLQDLAKQNEPFLCPYCRGIVHFKNQRAWRNHVFHDLRAYVCTHEGCDIGLFEDKLAWFEHELEQHRRTWLCLACSNKTFESELRFRIHLEKVHQYEDASTLASISASSSRPADEISVQDCPLCDDWPDNLNIALEERKSTFVSRTVFKEHLGSHLEQLALFAVTPDFERELDSEHGSRDGAPKADKQTLEHWQQDVENNSEHEAEQWTNDDRFTDGHNDSAALDASTDEEVDINMPSGRLLRQRDMPHFTQQVADFFVVGRLFRLWPHSTWLPRDGIGRGPNQNTGDDVTDDDSISTRRTYLVLQEGESECVAALIRTYGGLGVASKFADGCSQHATISDKSQLCRLSSGELSVIQQEGFIWFPFQRAQVVSEDLPPMARFSFERPQRIPHDVRVLDLGTLDDRSRDLLSVRVALLTRLYEDAERRCTLCGIMISNRNLVELCSLGHPCHKSCFHIYRGKKKFQFVKLECPVCSHLDPTIHQENSWTGSGETLLENVRIAKANEENSAASDKLNDDVQLTLSGHNKNTWTFWDPQAPPRRFSQVDKDDVYFVLQPGSKTVVYFSGSESLPYVPKSDGDRQFICPQDNTTFYAFKDGTAAWGDGSGGYTEFHLGQLPWMSPSNDAEVSFSPRANRQPLGPAPTTTIEDDDSDIAQPAMESENHQREPIMEIDPTIQDYLRATERIVLLQDAISACSGYPKERLEEEFQKAQINHERLRAMCQSRGIDVDVFIRSNEAADLAIHAYVDCVWPSCGRYFGGRGDMIEHLRIVHANHTREVQEMVALDDLVEIIDANPIAAEEVHPQPRGILKTPTNILPEHLDVARGYLARKSEAKTRVPPGSRFTKVDRKLISPRALEEAGERFEERIDSVLILRVLTAMELQKLADRTLEIKNGETVFDKVGEINTEKESHAASGVFTDKLKRLKFAIRCQKEAEYYGSMLSGDENDEAAGKMSLQYFEQVEERQREIEDLLDTKSRETAGLLRWDMKILDLAILQLIGEDSVESSDHEEWMKFGDDIKERLATRASKQSSEQPPDYNALDRSSTTAETLESTERETQGVHFEDEWEVFEPMTRLKAAIRALRYNMGLGRYFDEGNGSSGTGSFPDNATSNCREVFDIVRGVQDLLPGGHKAARACLVAALVQMDTKDNAEGAHRHWSGWGRLLVELWDTGMCENADLRELNRKFEVSREFTTIRQVACVCDQCQENIDGERYRCTQCEDYDLCAVCWVEGLNNRDHPHADEEFDFYRNRLAGQGPRLEWVIDERRATLRHVDVEDMTSRREISEETADSEAADQIHPGVSKVEMKAMVALLSNSAHLLEKFCTAYNETAHTTKRLKSRLRDLGQMLRRLADKMDDQFLLQGMEIIVSDCQWISGRLSNEIGKMDDERKSGTNTPETPFHHSRSFDTLVDIDVMLVDTKGTLFNVVSNYATDSEDPVAREVAIEAEVMFQEWCREVAPTSTQNESTAAVAGETQGSHPCPPNGGQGSISTSSSSYPICAVDGGYPEDLSLRDEVDTSFGGEPSSAASGHSGFYGRDIRCDECDRTYSTQSALRKHMRGHLPPAERPYPCNECDRAFLYMKDLQRHMRTHEKTRAFICEMPTCTASFTRKDHMVRHMKSRHGTDVSRKD